jgi:ADP-ribosylglycohydrolase
MCPVTKSQFVGSLIGQCLGDALGFVNEGASTIVCERYVEDVLRPKEIDEIKWGQYSDDSQLARELLLSYVSKGRFDDKDYARRIMLIFHCGRVVGGGFATSRAAHRLVEGIPLDEAGEPPPYAGNGTAMRAAPIGLIFYDSPDKLVEASDEQSRITHKDKRCSAGAIAIAGAVAQALRSDPIDVEEFCMKLSNWTRGYDPILENALANDMCGWIKLQPLDALTKISIVGLRNDFSNQRWEGISPFVTTSVLWSLYSFLRTPEDYWESICTAISSGGDVDTTAAMTGAISGTRVGIEGIPNDWARRVTDCGEWEYDDLVKLAIACYETRLKQ